jgi:hypothetical protein
VDDVIMRQCGGCTLCCKLLPMSAATREQARDTMAAMVEAGLAPLSTLFNTIDDFDKPAGERCPHQRHGKGCAIYEQRPFGCKIWTCRWLTNDDTDELRRPDKAGYVIDVAPDFVRTDNGTPVPVIQVWVDPKRRDAYKDPALIKYLKRRFDEGQYVLFRYNASEDCFFAYFENGEFREKRTELHGEHPHTALEKAAVLGGLTIKLVEQT